MNTNTTAKPIPQHEIDINLVYEWVKTGHWSKREFKDWLLAVKADTLRKAVNENFVSDVVLVRTR